MDGIWFNQVGAPRRNWMAAAFSKLTPLDFFSYFNGPSNSEEILKRIGAEVKRINHEIFESVFVSIFTCFWRFKIITPLSYVYIFEETTKCSKKIGKLGDAHQHHHVKFKILFNMFRIALFRSKVKYFVLEILATLKVASWWLYHRNLDPY